MTGAPRSLPGWTSGSSSARSSVRSSVWRSYCSAHKTPNRTALFRSDPPSGVAANANLVHDARSRRALVKIAARHPQQLFLHIADPHQVLLNRPVMILSTCYAAGVTIGTQSE